jgi:hypothetical protein
MLSSDFIVDLFLMRSRSQLLACQHEIARIERHLQRGGLGAGHRSYLNGKLLRDQATMTQLREYFPQKQARQSCIIEPPVQGLIPAHIHEEVPELQAQGSCIMEPGEREVIPDRLLEQVPERQTQKRPVKENPFLEALRAKGVKSLKEMADKTGKLEKKSG